MTLYDLDFHAWAHEQAALARGRSSNLLDWDNVAEELESLGKQQRSELRNRYRILLTHLLKWAYQPQRQGRSWTNTIRNQRDEIAERLRENPSLQADDAEVFVFAYRLARRDASTQTRRDEGTFPVDPPFTPEQARDESFWPGPAA